MTTIALHFPRTLIHRKALKLLATVKPAFLVRREADRLINQPDSTLSMSEDTHFFLIYHLRRPGYIYYHCFQPCIPSLVGCIRKNKLAPGQAAALRDIYYRTH